ncbi:MAG: daunorubicin ketoreductase [Glaciihabitans sp.]|nr:daunorubicin ketoreductase [Glaciihabitans sp.]
MARVFITGSSDGLGLAAGQYLIERGHEVVLHARDVSRADDIRWAAPDVAEVLIADLARSTETLELAESANTFGRFDAVIHNAAVGYRESQRIATPEGHAHVLAINVLAPYILTATMTRPSRLVFLTSAMARGGAVSTTDLDWTARDWNGAQAYSDSKLLDVTLAFAVARYWQEVACNAVEPGWVPTKMGGYLAPDNLGAGHLTQAWLAVSDDAAAQATGQLFYHRQPREAPPSAHSTSFQDSLLAELAGLTGIPLPDSTTTPTPRHRRH